MHARGCLGQGGRRRPSLSQSEWAEGHSRQRERHVIAAEAAEADPRPDLRLRHRAPRRCRLRLPIGQCARCAAEIVDDVGGAIVAVKSSSTIAPAGRGEGEAPARPTPWPR